MKQLYKTILGLGFISCSFGIPGASAVTYLTEENPPFNFTDAKKAAGISTNVVLEIAKRAGDSPNIRFIAWDEAYRMAQVDPNTCLYSTARLENRENLFQWVGPIAVNRWALFARDDFGKTISSETES